MDADDFDDAVLMDALSGVHDAFDPMPRWMQGLAPRWAQEHGNQQVLRRVQRWFGQQRPEVDRQRRDRHGRVVGPQRPDIQFRNPAGRGRPTYVEVDTDRRRMAAHIGDAPPPSGTRRVFLLVDPHTGALLEKHVIPASGKSYTRRARPGHPIQLTRRDLFDGFDGFEGGGDPGTLGARGPDSVRPT